MQQQTAINPVNQISGIPQYKFTDEQLDPHRQEQKLHQIKQEH